MFLVTVEGVREMFVFLPMDIKQKSYGEKSSKWKSGV